MPEKPESFRLFFALWPDSEVARQIKTQLDGPLAGCRGRRIPQQNLHITLAFLGSVDIDHLHCVQQVAARLRAPAFDLTLERLGYWSRPQIIWLAPAQTPPALLELQGKLSQALVVQCGYQAESRPFQAHLSVMRKVRKRPGLEDFPAIHWPVTRFSLLRSHTHSAGVEYELLNHWPLQD